MDDVGRFIEVYEKFRPCLDLIRFRLLTYKHLEGPRTVSGLVLLHSVDPGFEQSDFYRDLDFREYHFTEFSRPPIPGEILEVYGNGVVKGPNGSIYFGGSISQGHLQTPVGREKYDHKTGRRSYPLADQLIYELHLYGTGSTVPHPAQNMEFLRELTALEAPYESYESFIEDAMLGPHFGADSATRLKILLIPPLYLEEVQISDEIAEVAVYHDHRLDRSKISVGYILRHHGQILERKKVADWPVCSVRSQSTRIPAKNATSMSFFLHYEGSLIDRREVILADTVHSVHGNLLEFFDPGFDLLRSHLVGHKAGNDATKFEQAVLQLLTCHGLRGFTVTSNKAEIDVVLSDCDEEVKQLFFVECTGQNHNKGGKIAALSSRVKRLLEEQPNLSGISSIKCVISPIPRTAIVASDHQSALREDVALICREDLQDLLSHLPNAIGPENLFKFLSEKLERSRGDQ